MRWQRKSLAVFALALAGLSAQAQQRKFLASPMQVIAIRAGRLFDAKSGTIANNQTILVKGDRIADVGAAVQIPGGARLINPGNVTVLPGMIDTHDAGVSGVRISGQ